MSNDLTLAARLQLDSQRWVQGLDRAQGKTRGFVSVVRREMSELRSFVSSTGGVLASLGAGYTIASKLMTSARVDQQLTLIKQTAALTADETNRLRHELQRMAGDTGNAFNSLQQGFGTLAAGGQSFGEALPTIDAINKSMRVTGAQADTLATALQGAQTHFGFDLSQPGVALELLDKMTTAGRAGVIEIEDLSAAFAASAAEAKAAGLTFEETLALYEGFGTATTKDRLGTLVKSTLRVFTNANYMTSAQKATGVKFFDAEGERRGALEVIADIKTAYDKLDTDKRRFAFITKAFGQADLDTITGIRAALEGGKLQEILEITQKVQSARGTTMGGMDESMNNAVAQAGVLREKLSAAGDAFAQPVNSAFTRLAKLALGKKEDGGLEMSGGEVAAAGAIALATAYVGGRVGKGLLGKLSGSAASLGGGVLAGQALEQAGVATPVFVVNMPAGGLGGGLVPPMSGGTPAATRTGSKIGTGGLLARFGLATLGMSGPLSMLVDPRNYDDEYRGVDDVQKRFEGRKGFQWLRDLFNGEEPGASVGRSGKVEVSITLDDARSAIKSVRVNGEDANATVGIGRRGPNHGRMMASPGVF